MIWIIGRLEIMWEWELQSPCWIKKSIHEGILTYTRSLIREGIYVQLPSMCIQLQVRYHVWGTFLRSSKGLIICMMGPYRICSFGSMVKWMHDCMPILSSRNVPMPYTMVCYILNDLELEFLSPETEHKCRRLVFLTGVYLVITFGYSLHGKEGF